jgi:hypothetical protein
MNAEKAAKALSRASPSIASIAQSWDKTGIGKCHAWQSSSITGARRPMIVEESRILQVRILSTLQTNLSALDFSLLLTDVTTIADEVDSQLSQTIVRFAESAHCGVGSPKFGPVSVLVLRLRCPVRLCRLRAGSSASFESKSMTETGTTMGGSRP